jgi:ribonuclease HI
VIKINTDASFSKDRMAGGTDWVVRDHQGKLLRAQGRWYENIADARIMEALAIRDGATLAAERGFTHAILESDTKEVINICNDDLQNRSEIMAICQEVVEIRRALPSLSISFVGRDANNAAHLCAKQASSDRRRCLWINYNPDFLANTIRSDCNPVE